MADMKKFVLIVTMCVVAALSSLGLWWQFFPPKGGKSARDPISVEVEKVRMGSIVQRVRVTGVLEADNDVVIKPEVDGKIKSVNFKEGAYVNKGDVLIEIEDAGFKAKVKQAEAALVFAQQDVDRYSKLAAAQAGAFKNKEKAEADLLRAESELELAKLNLEHSVIRAPFAGYIGLKEYSPGAFIDQRTELLTIVDVDPITVDFRVPAVYLKSISKGQEVKVSIDSYPNTLFKATIEAIDPKVDPLANSVLVRGYIPNEDGKLKPGLFARVDMVVGSKDNALLLPESCVLSTGEESYVYRVVDATIKGQPVKVATKRPVVTGMSESGVIAITKGLSEGDEVISVGQSKGIQEGSPVRIVEDIEAEEAFKEDLNEVSKDPKPKAEAAPEPEPEADEPAPEEQPTEDKKE